MENIAPLATGDRGKASNSKLLKNMDSLLCSLCHLPVKNESSPKSKSATKLDTRFFTLYMHILHEFKDIYRNLDDSIPLFEKAIEDMKTFVNTTTPTSITNDVKMDSFTAELRQRTYKNHVRNTSNNLIADLTQIRIFLDLCFSVQNRIVEICKGIPETPMSQSVLNRSRGLLDILAKNTFKIRNKLVSCKCMIKSFDALKENVLHDYFVN